MVLQEKITNIVIAGAGGQGNLFVSKVLAQAAMDDGLQVKIAETYGVAMRGGSVHSQVRFGAGEFGPLIPAHNADAVLGLEPLEAIRLALDYVNATTIVVTNTHAIAPVQGKVNALPYPSLETMAQYFRDMQVQDFFMLDAHALAQDLKDARSSNMIMLGALIGSAAIPLSLDKINAAVGVLSPAKVLQQNLLALGKGFDFVQSQRANERSTKAC